MPADPIVAIGTGTEHTCAVRASGELWCWGRNDEAQLGVDDLADRATPVRVGSESRWASVRAHEHGTCALARDGGRWCWGQNQMGALGLGDDAPRTSPAAAAGETTHSVTLGLAHGCTLSLTRSLACFGMDEFGQLGLAASTDPQLAPSEILPVAEWRHVAAGQWYTCAIRVDGSLWCWGRNLDGKAGVGDLVDHDAPVRVGDANDWSSITAGGFHTCAVRADGSLWCWGGNLHGQLGLDWVGPGRDEFLPARVGDATSWSRAEAGIEHTCALTTGGALSCWGNGESGQLGVGSTETSGVPREVMPDSEIVEVATGSSHTCAIVRGGALWCWGGNARGQLGTGLPAGSTSPARVCF